MSKFKLFIAYTLTLIVYLSGISLLLLYFLTKFTPLHLFYLSLCFGILIPGPKLWFGKFKELLKIKH
jgi:hypothetical protein